MQITELAPAKINLSLDILQKRPDRFHEMDMLMTSVSLADELIIRRSNDLRIKFSCDSPILTNSSRNLAVASAILFCKNQEIPLQEIEIILKKRIPISAGLAGGSSDAAAVLRGLNRLFDAGLSTDALAEMGLSLGADVPYCVYGGTVRARGRGEVLVPAPELPPCFIVLCTPNFPIRTSELFAAIDVPRIRHRPDTEGLIDALTTGNLRLIGQLMYNVFEDVLTPHARRTIDAIRTTLYENGALAASMSGTGPTVFGLFDCEATANLAASELRREYRHTFVAKPNEKAV